MEKLEVNHSKLDLKKMCIIMRRLLTSITLLEITSSRRSKFETMQSQRCSLDSSVCLPGKVLKNRPQEPKGKSRPYKTKHIPYLKST